MTVVAVLSFGSWLLGDFRHKSEKPQTGRGARFGVGRELSTVGVYLGCFGPGKRHTDLFALGNCHPPYLEYQYR